MVAKSTVWRIVIINLLFRSYKFNFIYRFAPDALSASGAQWGWLEPFTLLESQAAYAEAQIELP